MVSRSPAASDSENSYLVEGQETANLIGGYSHTNVPFDFIQEVQVKSSGIEAEYGGALGGVVNVVMKKGTNQYHGSIFAQFENDAMDGSPNAYSRYDPNSTLTCPAVFCGTGNPTNGYIDAASQQYQPVRNKKSDVFPGFTFGGPIWKNKIFGFVGLQPGVERRRAENHLSGELWVQRRSGSWRPDLLQPQPADLSTPRLAWTRKSRRKFAFLRHGSINTSENLA